MLVGCSNIVDENNLADTGFMEDPQNIGLLAYEPITYIEYDDSLYSDYDSLLCHYGIKVIILDSNWSKKHDHLHIQRIKVDDDTNWWDYASLDGKNRSDTEWKEICNKGELPKVLDSCYYKMMELLDVIGYKIETRLFYFDSADWEDNKKYYESISKRKHVEFLICGEARIIIPSSTL